MPIRLLPIRPLRVIKTPTAAERSIELNDRKAPVPGSLRKADFSGVEQLLRFQDLIVASKAAKIAASGDGDGIVKSRHFTLLLFFDSGQLLRSDQSIGNFPKCSQCAL